MFRITEQPIDGLALRQALEAAEAGAILTFEGTVRNHHDQRPVRSLTYEADNEMAKKEGSRILQEARERYQLHAAWATHRIGHLEIGEVAVWVGVSASHRDAAFDACRHLIDTIKAEVPIWKLEQYEDTSEAWL